MYSEYWKLKEKPFNNTPDPHFFYFSPQHEDALMKMSYVITENIGAGMLTGVFGCGKTVIAHALMHNLKEGYRFCYISYPHLTAEDLLRSIVRNLTPDLLPESKSELLFDSLLEKLKKSIDDTINSGLGVVVIIDEAHIIKDEYLLESLRMLLNLQTEKDFLLTLLLVGQPELTNNVNNLKQLRQRIAVHCKIERMNKEETAKYIETRLNIAGGNNGIFTPGAIKKIYDTTSGIPRMINRVCELALFGGFANNKSEIDEAFIVKTIDEFGFKE